MDKEIIVSYNPFAKESQFYILNEGIMEKQYPVASNIDGVVEGIFSMAYNNEIYNVKIQSPLFFADEVKKQVAELEMATYSNNKINIEVM